MPTPATVRVMAAPTLADWDLGWVVMVAPLPAIMVAEEVYRVEPSRPVSLQRYCRPFTTADMVKEKLALL